MMDPQISEESEKSPNTSRKQNKVYVGIISGLLKNDELTCGELADYCGYEDKKKDKYPYVRRQVKRLYKDAGYLERTPDPDSTVKSFWIKRDLGVIQRLYEDKIYANIHSEFQQSSWLLDLIITKRMQEYVISREDAETMLRTSHLMFAWFLDARASERLREDEDIIIDRTLPWAKSVGINKTLCDSYASQCFLYDLFIACMFAEYRQTIISGTMPENMLQIIRIMNQKSAAVKHTLISHGISVEVMKNLASCISGIHNNNNNIPEFLEKITPKYNRITTILSNPEVSLNTVKTAEYKMKGLYTITTKMLRGESTARSDTGEINDYGPVTKQYHNYMKSKKFPENTDKKS